ncbi:MAG: Lrp/AsnC family transcriptional regulator [Candidatus Marinimicrobia bacterium]|nr:Lrp/AsnC family transcriptional regulator [Candidatus Neomarinimicrobiota bacterium]
MLDGNIAVEVNPGAGEIPLLTEYDPHDVGFHYPVIEDIRRNFDYSKGVQQIMLSGSVGSGKSLLMAHVLTTHAIDNPHTVVGLGRLTMPDLKDTILKNIDPGLKVQVIPNGIDPEIIIPKEKEKTIIAYKAVFDYKKIDEGLCNFILINLAPDEYTDPEKIAKELAKIPQIESVDICTGDWELVIKLRVKDQDEYYGLVKTVLSRKGINKIKSLSSLKQLKTEFVETN